jgi:hypothetical protein
MTWILVKLAIRLAAFTAVFWIATRPRKPKKGSDAKEIKPPRISIQPRWAIPVIGVLFAALNTLLYWLMRPVLDLATMRMFSLLMPLIVNGLLLWGTARIVEKKKWMKVDGLLAGAWLAFALTGAHGVLWVTLDYLPSL